MGWAASYYVYELYSAAGTCLYVGQAHNVANRLGEHFASQVWASDIATMRIRSVDTRDEALAHESYLIAAAEPIYNEVRPIPYVEPDGKWLSQYSDWVIPGISAKPLKARYKAVHVGQRFDLKIDYRSTAWRLLRIRELRRAGYRCEEPEGEITCNMPAAKVRVTHTRLGYATTVCCSRHGNPNHVVLKQGRLLTTDELDQIQDSDWRMTTT